MSIRRGHETGGNGVNITGSGNQVNTGKVSGGMHATYLGGGTEGAPKLEAAQAKLTELARALNAHASEVHNIEYCRTAMDRIDEELRSPSPDKNRIKDTFDLLSVSIGSVTSVLASAEALKTAITALFG
jgi:hypothetical protein